MRIENLSNDYINAWNAHDCVALSATFATDGVYSDPSVGEVSGKSPEIFAEHLWQAFPDLNFEVSRYAQISEIRVILEWVMRGTNTGSLMGLPPTDKSIMLKGIDVIEVSEDGIKSVTGYFDTKIIPTQLGLDVIVQPKAIGPFEFGTSISLQSGNKTKPGAFGITTIWNEADQTIEIQTRSKDTMKEMMRMEGFIGTVVARIGGRGITISAWEKPENIAQIMASPAHQEAMKQYYSNLSFGGFTSVWISHHINPMKVRCMVCNKMNDSAKGMCECGGTLAEAPAYF
ncbi:MAG: ester cyclase [Methylotenera sp.]|nr:ester cyclase [Methylotenera sp.]